MVMATRIDPETARAELAAGHALLVCAYDSDEKFRENYLDGAISLDELEANEDLLDREQEIIFYCA
jgi:rhodanese-related sulfurtransferase